MHNLHMGTHMLKLLGLIIILLSVSPLGIGVVGIAVNAWGHDWRGFGLSALLLLFGMVLADGGRYLVRLAATQQ
jgi:hypothetical protein